MNQYAPNARVWVYLSDRQLSDQEVKEIEQELKQFCRQWRAHGQLLRADAFVLHHRLVVLVADESVNAVSGCSIDASVRMLQQLGKRYGVDFLNRRLIALYVGGEIVVEDYQRLPGRLMHHEFPEEPQVFNTWLTDWQTFTTRFLIPLSESPWNRYLKQTLAP